ncbi:MAG: TRAP transporter small permease, partial [Gammaproteobacteria bacterium]|nr:TRAP transporter small permease [Gammaproteobacteria bacterium]
RAVALLSRACGMLAVLLMIAACAVVCQMVFVRYVLGASTIWQTEFVLFSIVAATLIGSPYVLATRGHVGVDFVASHAGPGGRRALGIVASLAGVAFCAVLAWSGWRYFHEALVQGWVTESVWAPPLSIVLLPLPLGIGLLTLQYVVDLACLVAGREPAAAESDA